MKMDNIRVIFLHLVKGFNVGLREEQVVISNAVVVVHPILDDGPALIQQVVIQGDVLVALLVNPLEEVLIHPILCTNRVGGQDEVQAEVRVAQTAKQLLVTCILDF